MNNTIKGMKLQIMLLVQRSKEFFLHTVYIYNIYWHTRLYTYHKFVVQMPFFTPFMQKILN